MMRGQGKACLGGHSRSSWTAPLAVAFGVFAVTASAPVQAQDAPAKASFIFNGAQVRIARENAQAAEFAASFTATDDSCGAACIAPLNVAPGVATLDEPQVLRFMMDEIANNAGLMVDARSVEDRARGFIPGSVSLPHSTVDPKGRFWHEIVKALGATSQGGVIEYSNARALLVYDTGPSTDDAGQLVRNLLAVGYPAEKIKYYRGGMQVWSVLGFNIEKGQS